MKLALVALPLFIYAGQLHAAELPAPLEPCVSMKRDAERLACYDRAVAAIRSASGSAIPAGAAPTAEDLFGANAAVATHAPADSDTRRDELKQIRGAVTSARRTDDGMIVLTLDNGQIWQQQDGNNTLFIESGDTVTVVRASLGTFRITDKRGRSARFKRTQ